MVRGCHEQVRGVCGVEEEAGDDLSGRRKKGRPNTRFMNAVKEDLYVAAATEDAKDRKH